MVDAEGVDDEAVKYGFAWLLGWEQRGFARVAVVVPQVGQLESLGRAIGEERAATLKKDRRLYETGCAVEGYSLKTLPYGFDDVPVLAVWLDDKQLDRLDNLRPAAICAVPWLHNDIEDWKAAWSPTDLRTGKTAPAEELSLSAVVVVALKHLTEHVNLGSGVGHPSDKDFAVGMFKALRHAGDDYDPGQVRAWAVRHGWKPEHANQLADIGAKIRAGRTVRGTGRAMWREDIVEMWRDEAQGRLDTDA